MKYKKYNEKQQQTNNKSTRKKKEEEKNNKQNNNKTNKKQSKTKQNPNYKTTTKSNTVICTLQTHFRLTDTRKCMVADDGLGITLWKNVYLQLQIHSETERGVERVCKINRQGTFFQRSKDFQQIAY